MVENTHSDNTLRGPHPSPYRVYINFVERSVNVVMTNVLIIWRIRFIDDFRFQEQL